MFLCGKCCIFQMFVHFLVFQSHIYCNSVDNSISFEISIVCSIEKWAIKHVKPKPTDTRLKWGVNLWGTRYPTWAGVCYWVLYCTFVWMSYDHWLSVEWRCWSQVWGSVSLVALVISTSLETTVSLWRRSLREGQRNKTVDSQPSTDYWRSVMWSSHFFLCR